MLDTRELGRRPGSQRRVSLEIEAPAELGIDILHVPEGSPVDIDLRLEAVMEGVLVTGTATAELDGECARCLGPLEDDLEVDFQELYVYDDSDGRGHDEDDDDVRRLEDDLLDLEPVLRDAVVLALPYRPLCQPDCPGLCIDCGARLADDPDHRHEEPIDPRWAGLQALAADQAHTDQPGPDGAPEKE